MPRHELDALGHQVVGNGHRRSWIAAVIGNLKHKLLAIDPAARIDVRDGQLTPWRNCSPRAAYWPSSGPAVAIRISAGPNAHGTEQGNTEGYFCNFDHAAS